jgi:hypothetical protein
MVTPLQPDGGLVPVQRQVQRSWISREELLARLRVAQSDAGLRDELVDLAGETTDDLGPIR